MNNRAPSLPHDRQTLTGDEPVLSGVNSRVLADRRGIYIAAMETGKYYRGIRHLIDMMSEEQQHAFKVRCVRLAVRKANSVLHSFESKYPNDSRPREAMELVNCWLNDPDSVTREELHYAADGADVSAFAGSSAVATDGTDVSAYAAYAAYAVAVTVADGVFWKCYRVAQKGMLRWAYIILARGER